METGNAIKIIMALANGINPRTGEGFSEKSPYRNPQTIQALLVAIEGLKQIKSAEERQKSPKNAGEYWKDDEDLQLISAFDAGEKVSQLAKKHQRSRGAIVSRLLMHGRVPPPVTRRHRVKKLQL